MNKRETENGNQPPHEETVDSRTAAAFLGIHYKTLERMARMGQVPAMKLGKEWQFLISLLSEWRKEQMDPLCGTKRRCLPTEIFRAISMMGKITSTNR